MREKIVIMVCFLIVGRIDAQSTLSISSRPDSANVYINETFYGKTPIEIFNIKGGYQSIKLEKDSLKSWWTLIHLKKDSSDQIYAVLDGDYGLLTLYTNPSGANVYLNDSLIGKTPLNEHEIKTGTYNIKIKKDNYSPWENYIEIVPNLKKMSVNLVSLFGLISFNNISTVQNLYLDGELLNSSNLKNYKLSVGNHGIQLLDTKFHKEIFSDINVESDNQYNIFFNYDEFSFKPLLYSAVIPGLGQIYSKSYLKGALILVSTLGAGYLTVLSISNYSKKTDEYNSFQGKYISAGTEEEASYYRSMTQNAYDKANTASTYKTIAIGALVGIYLYNLLDAVLFNSKIDVMHYYEQAGQYEIKNKIGLYNVNVGVQWQF
jgi:hypothetical protein